MAMSPQLKPYAVKLGFGESGTLARIFEILFDTGEKTLVAGAMPGSTSEISGRTGIPEKRVREIIAELKRRGAVNHVLHKGDYYRLFPAMIELRDSTVLSAGAPRELFHLWDSLIRNEMPALLPVLKQLNIPPMMRVVPVERTVDTSQRVLDVDSARKIISDAQLISAVPCACRTHARNVGRGKDCPAPETAVCLQVGAFAEAVLDRGIGERLSVTEALRRLGDAEDAGLVHLVRNNIKKDMFLCNCCTCCCTGMYLITRVGYAESFAPSRFLSKLITGRCTACGLCESRCAFGAISLGADGVPSIDRERCYGCGLCALHCPSDALVLDEVRPTESIRRT
jgi:ferredoxin